MGVANVVLGTKLYQFNYLENVFTITKPQQNLIRWSHCSSEFNLLIHKSIKLSFFPTLNIPESGYLFPLRVWPSERFPLQIHPPFQLHERCVENSIGGAAAPAPRVADPLTRPTTADGHATQALATWTGAGQSQGTEDTLKKVSCKYNSLLFMSVNSSFLSFIAVSSQRLLRCHLSAFSSVRFRQLRLLSLLRPLGAVTMNFLATPANALLSTTHAMEFHSALTEAMKDQNAQDLLRLNRFNRFQSNSSSSSKCYNPNRYPLDR